MRVELDIKTTAQKDILEFTAYDVFYFVEVR
jgi:hypothetical protein